MDTVQKNNIEDKPVLAKDDEKSELQSKDKPIQAKDDEKSELQSKDKSI